MIDNIHYFDLKILKKVLLYTHMFSQYTNQYRVISKFYIQFYLR